MGSLRLQLFINTIRFRKKKTNEGLGKVRMGKKGWVNRVRAGIARTQGATGETRKESHISN